jgi:hypothetical protein
LLRLFCEFVDQRAEFVVGYVCAFGHLAGGDGADGAEAVGEGQSFGMVEGEVGFGGGAGVAGGAVGGERAQGSGFRVQ